MIFSASLISSLTSKTLAQGCGSPTVVFSEDFGTGVGPVSWPDVVGLTYAPTGPLAAEGTYRVINDAQQKPEWHASEDGTTNNINGRMLVANGQAGTFYSRQIDLPAGFPQVNTLQACF